MKKILVTGGAGQVGQALQHAANAADTALICAPRAQLDITDSAGIRRALDALRPRLVINAAAYTAVDQAERERAAAFAVNRHGAENLAAACGQFDIPLLHLSTDYVFDGANDTPYREDAQPAPLNVYGQSKWRGEQAVQAACPRHIIVRTSGVFSAHGNNFVTTIVALAAQRKRLCVVADQTVCPTPAADLAGACLAIARHLHENTDAPWGVYHYCSNEPVSWRDFAVAIVAARSAAAALRAEEVRAVSSNEFGASARRPRYTVLCCRKIASVFGVSNRSWRHGLHDLMNTFRQ